MLRLGLKIRGEKNGTNTMKLMYADEAADVKCVYKVPVWQIK